MNASDVNKPDYGLVSIITPSYNSAAFIEETILSILAQTYTNWELLITDDCSTDQSPEIIDRYCQQDSRIRLFRLTKNSGAGVCRNTSIEAAQGRFIAFCDSDDCWYPQKLERQLAFMQEKKCALSYTAYMTCDEESQITGIVIGRKEESFFSMQCNNAIGCLTAIYDTKLVGKIYMPKLRKRQDWGLWLKILAKCGKACGMKEPLAIYRIRKNSISRNKFSLVQFNLNIYRKVLGFSLLKAYSYFLFLFLPTYFSKKIFLRYLNR